MKKIMFNDRYGLTQAVLDGCKTMTRRVVRDTLLDQYDDYEDYCSSVGTGGLPIERLYERDFFAKYANFKVGEVVAIAQRYCDILHCAEVPRGEEKGWGNKMYVKAGLMPHHIKITNIKVERLQDISDMDCLREGIKRCGLGKKFIPGGYDTPREAFAALINKVGKRGDWESNPWVFVYEFELVD